MKRNYERGAVSGGLIAIILLSIIGVALAGVSVWLYMQYKDQKTDVDGRVSLAVNAARNEQAKEDEKKFLLREKEPRRTFVGPKDYGRVSFDYPKTWSVHEAVDGSNRDGYKAYLSRIFVPPIREETQYAIRVLVEDRAYDDVLQQYSSLVQEGKLKTSSIKVNDTPATRLDGQLSEAIKGSVVLFKIRDKTITLRTDSPTFMEDFDHALKTLKFNQ